MCGFGHQTRKMLCREEGSFKISPGKCKTKHKLISHRKCLIKECSSDISNMLDITLYGRPPMIPHIPANKRAPRTKRKPNHENYLKFISG